MICSIGRIELMESYSPLLSPTGIMCEGLTELWELCKKYRRSRLNGIKRERIVYRGYVGLLPLGNRRDMYWVDIPYSGN